MNFYKKQLFIGMLCGIFTVSAWGNPVRITQKAISETIEIAAKRSGKILTPAAKAISAKVLKVAVSKYGDDALRMTKIGGLEFLEQGAKHGRPFWEICSKASPKAIRSMALHADDLMPIAQRVGPDFLTLEAKAPGLGKTAIEIFGDQSVNRLNRIPEKDFTRFIGFAKKSDSPETTRNLLEYYEKSSGKILDHLNWKHIMAGGLSTATIIAAYKVSDGIQHDPTIRETFSRPLITGLWVGVAILLLFLSYHLGLGKILMSWKK